MFLSDLGKAFKLRLDALNRQGQRPTDLTSGQNEQKSSRDEVATMFGISGSKVHRYMRLTYLIPQFQEAVDTKKMLLSIAENISYLRESEQKILHQILTKDKRALTCQQSIALKSARKKDDKSNSSVNLTKQQIMEILSTEDNKEAPIKKKPVNKKVLYESIVGHKYFKDKDMFDEDMLALVMKALDNSVAVLARRTYF